MQTDSGTTGTASPKAGLVDANAVKDGLGDKEKKAIILKIKRGAPKASVPGNWKEGGAVSMYSLAAVREHLCGSLLMAAGLRIGCFWRRVGMRCQVGHCDRFSVLASA